jgi:transposase-like protein
VSPAKSVDESTVRLLLDNREQESLTVYTDRFRAYEPLDDDDTFDRQYVVHRVRPELISASACSDSANLVKKVVKISFRRANQK